MKLALLFALTVFIVAGVKPVYSEDTCSYQLLETIPYNLHAKAEHTHVETWVSMLNNAKSHVKMTAMYWSLTSSSYGHEGKQVYQAMMDAGKRGVQFYIVQDYTSGKVYNESQALVDAGFAKVKNVPVQEKLGGILHTKLWLIDDEHVYVGSANMDFRSVSVTKEMGIAMFNCRELVADMDKVFESYWMLADAPGKEIPAWPSTFDTKYNGDNKMALRVGEEVVEAFVSASPEQLCPDGRDIDLDSILKTILSAEKTLDIAIMDIVPRSLYADPIMYWNAIFEAIQRVVLEKSVHVRVMMSAWGHSPADWLEEIARLTLTSDACAKINVEQRGQGECYGSIEVRAFEMPKNRYGYAHPNHVKFLVADDTLNVGTNNWSRDYFYTTLGVSLNIHSPAIAADAKKIFDRDWDSEYTKIVKTTVTLEDHKGPSKAEEKVKPTLGSVVSDAITLFKEVVM
eukprot:GFYU01005967.1.p1 GENE.GFYU01005967.1~~GFYU01005967.1.p1  ORF type:complete len:456 (-),score=156.37 GFYU01005967.1:32-1399(-)